MLNTEQMANSSLDIRIDGWVVMRRILSRYSRHLYGPLLCGLLASGAQAISPEKLEQNTDLKFEEKISCPAGTILRQRATEQMLESWCGVVHDDIDIRQGPSVSPQYSSGTASFLH